MRFATRAILTILGLMMLTNLVLAYLAPSAGASTVASQFYTALACFVAVAVLMRDVEERIPVVEPRQSALAGPAPRSQSGVPLSEGQTLSITIRIDGGSVVAPVFEGVGAAAALDVEQGDGQEHAGAEEVEHSKLPRFLTRIFGTTKHSRKDA